MPWKRWNCANRTLFFCAVLFLFALAVNHEHKGNLFAAGFLAVTEAALVGGLADWFAVTALFRKPLGFPYHTALLPRRREALIEATLSLFQSEFFSRKRLLGAIQHVDFIGRLVTYLQTENTRKAMTRRLLVHVRDFLATMDKRAVAQMLAQEARKAANEPPAEHIMLTTLRFAKENGSDRRLLEAMAKALLERVQNPTFPLAIEEALEHWSKERVKGRWNLFLLGLGHATGMVDFGDMAKALQKEAAHFLESLIDHNTQTQTDALWFLRERADELAHAPETIAFVDAFRQEILNRWPLEAAIDKGLNYVEAHFLHTAPHGEGSAFPALRDGLLQVIETEYDRFLRLLQGEDMRLRHEIEGFLYDVAARTVLAARDMIGLIVRDVLSQLTDEQLNHLVIEKVEDDLLWIRMNGSIVGATLGLLLFLLLTGLKSLGIGI